LQYRNIGILRYDDVDEENAEMLHFQRLSLKNRKRIQIEYRYSFFLLLLGSNYVNKGFQSIVSELTPMIIKKSFYWIVRLKCVSLAYSRITRIKNFKRHERNNAPF
jgi:hypothetical protein